MALTTRSFRPLFAIPAAALLLAMAPLAVDAAPKEVVHVTTDETYVDWTTSAYCGFRVRLHEVSEYTITTKASRSGKRFQYIGTGTWTYTFTAIKTGQVVEVFNTLGFFTKVSSTDARIRVVDTWSGINYRVETADGMFTSEGTTREGFEIRYADDGTVSSARVLGRPWPASMLHLYPRLCVYLGAVDTDGDFLPDDQGIRTEVRFGTNPLNPDTDGDGYVDGDEVGNEKDPLDPASNPGTKDKDPDRDDDFFADGREVLYGTDPRNPDTDGDGALDGWELFIFGTDPEDPGSHP